MKKVFLLLSVTCSLQSQIIDVNKYGWLDQYSLNDFLHGFVGDECCTPTASINGLTYLQNALPGLFSTYFTGSDYESWIQADITIVGLMDTRPVSGTFAGPFYYGLQQYLRDTGFPNVYLSGSFPIFPQVSGIVNAATTIEQISTGLCAGSAVILGLVYINGNGGHSIVVNGLEWDAASQSGTLYFVDSLDPSQNYSPTVPQVLGPVKQTTGSISSQSGILVLTYDQYEGNLPYNGMYATASAVVEESLFVGAAPYTPFGQLVSQGNLHAVAVGFDAIDPTTFPMFNIMAILNTTTDLPAFFEQLDPSPLNATLMTEVAMAEQVRIAISNNLMEYRHPCYVTCCKPGITTWVAPLRAALKQRRWNFDDFKETLLGTLLGVDYFFANDFLVGAGFSYVNGSTRFLSIQDSANLNSYGGFVHGAWFGSPLWIDLNFAYNTSRVDGKRFVYTESTPYPFLTPISPTITQKYNSDVYTAHLGFIYDLWLKTFSLATLDLWPFMNLDFIFAHQPCYSQQGGGPLNLTVNKKWCDQVRPEIGLGTSLFSGYGDFFLTFIHATLSYVNETYLAGETTQAYFTAAGSDAAFTTKASLPNNHLISPGIQAGLRDTSDSFRFSINFRGEYGSKLISNQVSLELNQRF